MYDHMDLDIDHQDLDIPGWNRINDQVRVHERCRNLIRPESTDIKECASRR